MIHLTTIKQSGTGENIDEVQQYKSYIERQGFEVNSLFINVPTSSSSDTKVPFTISYTVDQNINPVIRRL